MRDFAAKQNQEGTGLIAAGSDEKDTEAGMEEMSRVYTEGGRELYIGAIGRGRD